MKQFIGFLSLIDQRFEEAISMAIMVLIAVFMIMQVCARYIFNSSLSWPEELCVYLLIWMGMLSLSYCIRTRTSIKVEMIIDLFPSKVRTGFYLLEDVISIVFYGFLCLPAWQLLCKSMASGQVSAALHIPMYLIQISPLAAFVLAVVRSAQDICFHLRGLSQNGGSDS